MRWSYQLEKEKEKDSDTNKIRRRAFAWSAFLALVKTAESKFWYVVGGLGLMMVLGGFPGWPGAVLFIGAFFLPSLCKLCVLLIGSKYNWRLPSDKEKVPTFEEAFPEEVGTLRKLNMQSRLNKIAAPAAIATPRRRV